MHATFSHKSIVCRVCQNEFTDAQSLIQHVDSVHENDIMETENNLDCFYCEKNLSDLNQDTLTKHVQCMHNFFHQEKYKPMKFFNESNSRSSTKESKEFDCPFCLRKFFLQELLNLHLKNTLNNSPSDHEEK